MKTSLTSIITPLAGGTGFAKTKQTGGLMKRRLLLLIMAGLFTANVFSLDANAGNSGGGGGAEKCPITVNGKLTHKYYLFDFWIAQKGFLPFKQKLNIPRSNLPVKTQIEKAIQKMRTSNPDFADAIEASYAHILNHNLKAAAYINPPDDIPEPFNCARNARIGLAYYDDINDVLDYDPVTVAKMDNTDQAGFWIHESVYRILRLGSHEDTSLETHLIVGALFSDQPLEPMIAHRLKKSFLCSSPVSTNPKDPHDGVKYLFHTDGNETVMMPISVTRYGLPSDKGGEFFWQPTGYLIDSNGRSTSALTLQNASVLKATNQFGGKLSELLMHIGQPIDKASLYLPYVPLSGSAPAVDIPIRTKYYGIKLDFNMIAGWSNTVENSSDFTTPAEYESGVMKFWPGFGETSNTMLDNSYTLIDTCREF